MARIGVADPLCFNTRLQIAGLVGSEGRAKLARALDPTPHLIVDDDVEISALLSKFLAGHGYRVSVAASGSAVMRRLADTRVDLVVLDIMLLGKDGLALCRELRAGSRLPIIMLTAIGAETDRIVGLEMGADDLVRGRAASPFDRAIDVHVSRLRKRLEADPELLRTMLLICRLRKCAAAPSVNIGTSCQPP